MQKEKTPLHHASQYGHEDCVTLLLAHGSDPQTADKDGQRPLSLATSHEHIGVVKVLLRHYAKHQLEEDEDEKQPTPLLHLAILQNSFDTVKLLLRKQVRIDDEDAEGNTALHLAIQKGYSNIGKLLLHKGASLEIQNNEGNTALHLAIQQDYGNIDGLLFHKGAGATLEIKNSEDYTPLQYAAHLGRTALVKSLHECGANMHVLDEKEANVLHIAALAGHEEVVEYFLKQIPKSIRARDANDETPLHAAVRSGDLATVHNLLKEGARVNVHNEADETPISLAQGNGLQLIENTLLGHDNPGAEGQIESGETHENTWC